MVQTAMGLRKWEVDFLRHFENADEVPLNITLSTGGPLHSRPVHGGGLRANLTAVETAAVSLISRPNLIPDKAVCVAVTLLLSVSDVSEASFFFGLTDANDDAVIIEDENGTLNTVATDAVGFLFEGEQDQTLQRIAVINGSDGVQAALSESDDLEDDVKFELRLVAWKSGLAEFFINGRRVAAVKDYFDPSEEYGIGIGFDGRATAYTATLDKFIVETEVAA